MNESRESLDQHLRRGDVGALEFLDIVPIPMNGDRTARLRTLEEALEDFASDHEATSYLIQIRPKKRAAAPAAAPSPRTIQDHAGTPASSPVAADNIYQGDGKLNLPYLTRNAELLLAAGEYTLARNIYRAIAASGERTGLALFGAARCDEAEGRLEEARAHYEESIAYHPTLDAYRRLGAVLMGQNKDGLAAEAMERALNLKDLEARTRFELHKACGNCWTRARVADKADKHYRQALDIDPAADDIRSNLGALHLQSKNIVEARRCFEDALGANPRNAKALAGLASCHAVSGDKRRAHDLFAQSLDIELSNPAAIYHLIKIAYEIRSYATAARLVEDYVQTAPVNVSLMYGLAGLQYHLGRMNDARATALQTLGLKADHEGARELLRLIDRSGT